MSPLEPRHDPRDVLWTQQFAQQVFRLRCIACDHPRPASWRLPKAWQVHLDSGEVAATCSDRCRERCLRLPDIYTEREPTQ